MITVCCFERVFLHSYNLYGPWFVFITECEFDKTENKDCLELQHVKCMRRSYTSISEMVSKSSK